MAELDLDDDSPPSKSKQNKAKMQIPLHENLPKDFHKDKQKDDPELLKELQFVSTKQDSFKVTRVAGKVKEGIYALFEKRAEELESLKRLVQILKNFIKRYKPAIIKLQLDEIKMMEELVKEKRKLQGEYDRYEKTGALERIKEIDDELVILREQSKDLSVKHFVNLSEDYLTKLQEASDSPNTKIRSVLTPAQIKKWNDIIILIPSSNQVYIQKSLSQLKGIQKDYQDWVEQNKKQLFNEEQEPMKVKVSA